jgi:hypothetical protein
MPTSRVEPPPSFTAGERRRREKLIPDSDELLRAIPRLKEELSLNVELAAPSDFIPVPDGWEERSPLIRREGKVSFHHFDPVAQALSKAERGHEQDGP